MSLRGHIGTINIEFTQTTETIQIVGQFIQIIVDLLVYLKTSKKH